MSVMPAWLLVSYLPRTAASSINFSLELACEGPGLYPVPPPFPLNGLKTHRKLHPQFPGEYESLPSSSRWWRGETKLSRLSWILSSYAVFPAPALTICKAAEHSWLFSLITSLLPGNLQGLTLPAVGFRADYGGRVSENY